MNQVNDAGGQGEDGARSPRDVLGDVGTLEWVIIGVAVICLAASGYNPKWMTGSPVSFDVSAKISVGLTLLAIAIAVGIFRNQKSDARASEDRLSASIEGGSGSVLAAIEAYDAKNLARPSDSSKHSFTRAVSNWLSAGPGSTRTVLWVDDDQSSILWEKRTLERAGIEVIWAPDSQSALHLLDVIHPNLIISDMRRGHEKLAGLGLLREIRSMERENGTKVPFLVYSSRATDRQIDNVISQHGQGQFADPIALLSKTFEILVSG